MITQTCLCDLYRYSIMMQCWHSDPRHRPSFQHLVISISDVVSAMEAQQNNSFNTSRIGSCGTSFRPSTSSTVSDYLTPSPAPLLLNPSAVVRSPTTSVSSPVDVISNDDVWIADEAGQTDDEGGSGRTGSTSDDQCPAVTNELTDSGVICGRGCSVSDTQDIYLCNSDVKSELREDHCEDCRRSSAVARDVDDEQQQQALSWRCTTVWTVWWVVMETWILSDVSESLHLFISGETQSCSCVVLSRVTMLHRRVLFCTVKVWP